MKINITLIAILCLIGWGLRGHSQANAQYVKSSTAAGPKVVRYPNFTVANTAGNVGVEKSLLPNPDTIFASSMTVGSVYRFSLQINITTPLLSAGNLTLKVKMGGTSVLTVSNGVSLNLLNNTVPVYLEGEIEVKSMTSQLVNARIVQWNGTVIPIGTALGNMQANWTNDLTAQQIVDFTATFTGVTLGTTSFTSQIFRRYIEQ